MLALTAVIKQESAELARGVTFQVRYRDEEDNARDERQLLRHAALAALRVIDAAINAEKP